jgi:hypothetical protein
MKTRTILLGFAGIALAAAAGACSSSSPSHWDAYDTVEWGDGRDGDPAGDDAYEAPDLRLCEPGERMCVGESDYRVCNADGTAFDPGGSCEPGTTCKDGMCFSPCERAEAERSSIGCVYYAVDTNPFQSVVGGDYAVAVSNTDLSNPANILIEVKEGGAWSPVAGGTFSLSPLSLRAVVLPHRYIDGSAIYRGGAYRITSDLPIIAYQFNPLDGSNSYLSDASLLLPTSALDAYHFVAAWPQGPADETTPAGWPAHVQIAAAGPTNVTVTASSQTAPGGEVPALYPGSPQTFSLEEGDYLQLTIANHMNSFTGTYVESDGPVAVFSANDCVNVPAEQQYCCCEHLEEQIFGLQTWGKTYVASRVPQRASEPAVWQIIAHQDGTVVSFDYDPSVTGLPPSVTLNRGQSMEYLVNGAGAQPGDFYISATGPILVTQFIVGAFMVSYGSDNGDPSMVQAVPTDQYLDRYVVLVPTTWQTDYFVLTRPGGSEVRVDGTPVSTTWTPVGASPYEVGRVNVPDGVHVVDGDSPFGIIILGYDPYDSYAYPGGLNLQVINPII